MRAEDRATTWLAGPDTLCHVIAQLRLGAGRAVVELARAQRRMGRAVVVAVATDVDEQWRSEAAMIDALESADVRVLTLGRWFGRDPARILEAASQLREHVRDSSTLVVHAHSGPAISVGRLAGAETIVATCHGWNPSRPARYDAQDAAAYRPCGVVTSPSRFWADRLTGDWLVPRVEVVPYGLDLSSEPHDEPTPHDGGPRIVTVCELTHRKGVDVLLDSMALLWRDVPAATLSILGRGEAEHELRSQADRIDPGGQRISFEGWVPSPRNRLGAFSLFCLASRSDNYPLAIMDAMLSGMPIVSTRVGGIPEAIDDSGCGLIVPPDDAGLLADAMRRLLVDASAAAAAGARGRAYAHARFDVNVIAQTFARLYRGASPSS